MPKAPVDRQYVSSLCRTELLEHVWESLEPFRILIDETISYKKIASNLLFSLLLFIIHPEAPLIHFPFSPSRRILLMGEDNAIEEALYYLDKALEDKRIEPSDYLQESRRLAVLQFQKRALVHKIQGLLSPATLAYVSGKA